MFEVRFHGRGGQGAQMAAQALASAAFEEGKYAVAFPFFGAERRGAPVFAFARVDDKKIRIKTQIYEPDYVVVLDESLLETVNVTEGIKEGGTVIINTRRKPGEIDLGRRIRTATVDATGVALEVLGRDITNSAILGAIAKATGEVSIEAIEKGILDKFVKLGARGAARNAEAARVSFRRTVIGESRAEKTYEAKKTWLPTYKELPLGAAAGYEVMTDAGLVGLGSFVENKTGGWRTFRPHMAHELPGDHEFRRKDDGSDKKCIECLFCWFYCPEGCITKVDRGESPNGLKYDLDYCKGCGICADVCPVDYIEWGTVRA